MAIPNLETEPNLGGVSHDAVVAPVVVVVVVIIVVVPFVVVVVVVAVGADDLGGEALTGHHPFLSHAGLRSEKVTLVSLQQTMD